VTPPDGSVPRLVIIYGGSATDHSPLRLAEAADGICSLIWVVAPHDGPEDHATARFIARLGDVVDVDGMSTTAAADAIRAQSPEGIVCFTDKHLVWAARIAERLGLPFYSPATAERLTDKLAQRTALRAHGLPTPGFWDVDDLADPRAFESAVESGFPFVLKPRRGTSSQDTERVGSREQLRAAIAACEPGRMLLEGYIPDPSVPPTGAGSAPYASVELLVSRGAVSALGITGRTPLAPPFRETGFLFPADVRPGLATELTEAAVQAVQALGVETGVLHVELKCTDAGPVVIEVNGRPGGAGVHYLLRRSLGVDTVQLAMRVAIGEQVRLDDVAQPVGVVFRLDVQPDARLRTITAVRGLDEALEIPGVEQVIPGVGPGDEVSWRSGTLGYAAAVLGTAPDHAAAARIRDEILDLIVVTGAPEEEP
jgi:biotin carboxylase